MDTKHRRLRSVLLLILLISAGIVTSACAISSGNDKLEPLIIQEQGSFAVGGIVITNPGTYDSIKQGPDGQTFHGDHAYVFYQIPPSARRFPLVLWHGHGQFSKTWETTPDGREGYQNIFLRRGFGVYVIDQPRRGDAGRSTLPITIRLCPMSKCGSAFPPRHLAELFPRRAVLARPRDPEPVLPRDDAEYGPLRCGCDLGHSCCAVR